MTERSASPLVVTDDQVLLADLVRLAAAAGVMPEVAHDVATALRSWTGASVVLVGTDRVGELALAHPPRRSRVHVVGNGQLPDLLFREALDCGAESVAALPASEGWLVELLTDAGDGAGRIGTTIAVVGGAGGVGATVFAAALGQVVGARVGALLVDADSAGAGADRVLGLEQTAGVRWDALLHATGRLSARSLRDALPQRAGLSVLTWPVDREPVLPAIVLREALSAGKRGFDAIVVDMPRHANEVLDEVLARCDQIVLVSTTTLPAVSAAARVARRLPPATSRVVLRERSGGVPTPEVARLLGLPVLATMSDQRGLDEAISLGIGPLRSKRGPLARASRTAADVLLVGGDRA